MLLHSKLHSMMPRALVEYSADTCGCACALLSSATGRNRHRNRGQLYDHNLRYHKYGLHPQGRSHVHAQVSSALFDIFESARQVACDNPCSKNDAFLEIHDDTVCFDIAVAS